MKFIPRPYQKEGIDIAVDFLRNNKRTGYNGLQIYPTGSGKSVILANIAAGLDDRLVIFQPSKEILEQNYAKYTSYGYRASIYSASLGEKYIDQVTFATIGSVASKPHLFKKFRYGLFDECHLVNPEEGMYRDFVAANPQMKLCGFTATPYRLESAAGGAQLKWITQTNPRIFNEVLYYVQNDLLFNSGNLAPLDYYSFNKIDRTALKMNSSGTDFTESSVRAYLRKIDFPRITVDYARMILQKKENLLIFSSTIEDARLVSKRIPGSVVVTGDTPSEKRAKYLNDFKAGRIRCVINVGVLTTGFDFPGLEAVLIARSTMSLSLYYQIIGRVMRFYKYPDGSIKRGMVVDLGGNIEFFGKIETMKIKRDRTNKWYISNSVNGRERRLTDVPFSEN
jgi:DNA repair protein RadD